jgi:hypothetical protein
MEVGRRIPTITTITASWLTTTSIWDRTVLGAILSDAADLEEMGGLGA